MKRPPWWQKPQLRNDEELSLERKVTWLELYFDLIFVVLISQLSQILFRQSSIDSLIQFILMYIPVWWIWVSVTYFVERFETDGIEIRIFLLGMMIPLAFLAMNIQHSLSEGFVFFASCYAFVRLLTLLMWIRSARHDHRFKPIVMRFIVGFGSAITLSIAAIFFEHSLQIYVWIFAIAIDVMTPLFTMKLHQTMPRHSRSKLPERFGLFTIIVLGESVVGVIQGLSRNYDLSLIAFVEASVGLMISMGLWWVYFDYVAGRPPKIKQPWTMIWTYIHLPLVMSITALGAGIQKVLSAPEGVMTQPIQNLICYALSGSFISLFILEISVESSSKIFLKIPQSPVLKGVLGCLILWLNQLIFFKSFLLLVTLWSIIYIPIIYQLIFWSLDSKNSG